jgi:hypothetical protein
VATLYILVQLGFVVESARLGDGGVKVQVPRSQQTLEAYATLLYGDEFLLGVRMLGKSIRDTGTIRDMVALVSDGVSPYAVQLLQVFFFSHFSSVEVRWCIFRFHYQIVMGF